MTEPHIEDLGPSPVELIRHGKPLTDLQRNALPAQIAQIDKELQEAEKSSPVPKKSLIKKSPVAAFINAVEQKRNIRPQDRLNVINRATESQLLMLKNANVITEEEYIARHQKILDQRKADQMANNPSSSNLLQKADSDNPMLNWLRDHGNALWPKVRIQEMRLDRTKAMATLDKYVPPFSPQYQDAVNYLNTHPGARSFNVSVAPDGHVNIGEFTTTPQEYSLSVERGKLSRSQAEAWIRANVPVDAQENALREIGDPNVSEFSVGRDEQGRVRIRAFQTPNPWTNIKKEAQQSVTREIRREVGKQGNRLINPDYAHNEMINQYKLVRDALPPDTATRKLLEKTDGVVSAVLTANGLTVEATNLLVNAVRGALLEAPELRYKVAALVPDDLVRQTYVAAVRTGGNTLREFIHKKYHLPDRPKKTPVMVNTLDQIKPEHYRAQDAQKVGITMRDLSREKAIKFIHDNAPIEKQESAIETLSRLEGNQFGVSIMDSGWVRIDASAREPRKYEDRPKYDNRQRWVGSFDASNDTKMP